METTTHYTVIAGGVCMAARDAAAQGVPMQLPPGTYLVPLAPYQAPVRVLNGEVPADDPRTVMVVVPAW